MLRTTVRFRAREKDRDAACLEFDAHTSSVNEARVARPERILPLDAAIALVAAGAHADELAELLTGVPYPQSESQPEGDRAYTILTAIAEIQETGKDIAMIGVDADLYETNSENKGLFLTSILKGMKAGVADTVTEAGGGKFDAAAYIGTLENEGVGLAPFHDLESSVPADLAAEVDALRDQIVAGTVTVDSPDAP